MSGTGKPNEIAIFEQKPIVEDNNIIFQIPKGPGLVGHPELTKAIENAKRLGIAGVNITESTATDAQKRPYYQYTLEVSTPVENPFKPGEDAYVTNKEALTSVIKAMLEFDRANNGSGLYMSKQEEGDYNTVVNALGLSKPSQQR